MKTQKNVGIWMDHLNANLIDLEAIDRNRTITSKFNYDVQDEAIRKSEKGMHNKRQQLTEDYYKEIADVIVNYDQVLLFGPTNAKTELYNYIADDLHFKDIKIQVEPTDKMTDNQKDAFVKKYFEN
jgi:stalled ribosome rescue protein Dom34